MKIEFQESGVVATVTSMTYHQYLLAQIAPVCVKHFLNDVDWQDYDDMAMTMLGMVDAMIKAEKETSIPAAVPDGYALVPVEPTEEMMLHNSECKHHAWDDPDCSMRETRRRVWAHMIAAASQASIPGKAFEVTLPDSSSKAFWSNNGKVETFHPEVYKRWVKEAIERSCLIAGIGVRVK